MKSDIGVSVPDISAASNNNEEAVGFRLALPDLPLIILIKMKESDTCAGN